MHSRLLLPALSLLALGLTGCGPSEKATAAPAPAAPAAAPVAVAPAKATDAELAAGKAVYQRVCIVCHMAEGQGVPGAFPPLNGSQHLAESDPTKLIRIVLHGLQGPVEVAGKTYNNIMPPQGPLLKDHEIAKVLTYVRHTWGNGAPAVTDAAVAQERKQTKRTTPWTMAELNQK